jgi:hypothetical protein
MTVRPKLLLTLNGIESEIQSLDDEMRRMRASLETA